jgi:hypothetical protein
MQVRAASHKHQASSRKQQASSTKRFKQQAASIKLRATSIKRQAASSKLLDFIALIKIREARSEGLNLYIEQKIIHHNKVQDLTTDELKAKMKKILDDNKGLIEADFAEVIEPTKKIEN